MAFGTIMWHLAQLLCQMPMAFGTKKHGCVVFGTMAFGTNKRHLAQKRSLPQIIRDLGQLCGVWHNIVPNATMHYITAKIRLKS